MKEILFEFEEFKDRIAKLQEPRVHSAYRRKDDRDGLFAFFEFRMYCPESENSLLVFEKTLSCVSYEEDKIKAFRDECRGLSEKLLATPGYFEEGAQ
jgi:hypothetical protein